MRKLYLNFPKVKHCLMFLSWTHYFEILRIHNGFELTFFIKQCEKENRSVWDLKRQMKNMLFHRLALSKEKKGIIERSEKGQQIQEAEDILKDLYMVEFLDILQANHYLESELEQKLISNLHQAFRGRKRF